MNKRGQVEKTSNSDSNIGSLQQVEKTSNSDSNIGSLQPDKKKKISFIILLSVITIGLIFIFGIFIYYGLKKNTREFNYRK